MTDTMEPRTASSGVGVMSGPPDTFLARKIPTAQKPLRDLRFARDRAQP